MCSTAKWRGTEERIHELENRTLEITQSGQQRENKLEKKSEQNARDSGDYKKRSNIHVTGI